MKTSLKDIAEELRLSKTTVSWVLSGRGNERGISQATQDRVKQCARRMNYQPNLLARSLNTGVSSTIGLILPSISDSFYSQVAREVEMEAERHGYSLMICSSESEGERENRMIWPRPRFRRRRSGSWLTTRSRWSFSTVIFRN